MKNKLEQQLDSLIVSVHSDLLKKNIIVPRYEKGRILVGDVAIVQNGSTKDIFRNNELIYRGVFLNKVAIFLANGIAIRRNTTTRYDFIYRNDQNYGVYMQETLFFDSKYKQAFENRQYDKADIFYARWQVSKEKAQSSKRYVLSLVTS